MRAWFFAVFLAVAVPGLLGCGAAFARVVVEVAATERCVELDGPDNTTANRIKDLQTILPELTLAARSDRRARVILLEAEWLIGFSIVDATGETSEGLDKALEHFQKGRTIATSALTEENPAFESELEKIAELDDSGNCDIATRVQEIGVAMAKGFPMPTARADHPALFTLLALHISGEALISGFGGACPTIATTLGVIEHAVALERSRRDLFLDRSITCPGTRGLAHMLSVVLAERAAMFQPTQRNPKLITERTSLARTWLGEPRWLDFVISKYGEQPLDHRRLCQILRAPPGLYKTPLHHFLLASADAWYASEVAKTLCP